MRRKLIYLTLVVMITIVVWIYWTSNTEFNNTILMLKHNNYLNKDILNKPSYTICTYSTFILIIVTSYVGHVELRSAHRRAMPVEYLKKFNTTRIFLTAKIPNKEKYITQEAIRDEANIFGDILQGSFTEDYRNLTLKHLMGLQWAATHCHNSTFILKVDDDTVFNLEKTYYMLMSEKNINKNNFLMGYMLNNTKPRRDKENKWYVTWDEYPRNDYPPYVSGWYYITTPSVASILSDEATYHPYFWIDDIFITGILTEALNIKLRQLPTNYWLEYYELLECCLRDMISKFIRCDYVVGPNGGRNNLIVEFNEAVRNCYTWKNCTTRSIDQLLNKQCVNFRERTIFSNGHPEVENIKL